MDLSRFDSLVFILFTLNLLTPNPYYHFISIIICTAYNWLELVLYSNVRSVCNWHLLLGIRLVIPVINWIITLPCMWYCSWFVCLVVNKILIIEQVIKFITISKFWRCLLVTSLLMYTRFGVWLVLYYRHQ